MANTKSAIKRIRRISKQTAVNRARKSKFKNASGKKGNYQKEFNVYDRDGLNCKRPNCKGIIQKKMISNRSTFFCNSCQK